MQHSPIESPPSHDFAFYEWDYPEDGKNRPQQPHQPQQQQVDDYGGEEEESKPLGEDSLSPPSSSSEEKICTKNSIEDLMQPSIFKSLLSRELGGSTDLSPELFSSVPRDVIEIEGHRAVSSGHVSPECKAKALQREFAESRLRRTAPGALMMKPDDQISHSSPAAGRRSSHFILLRRGSKGDTGSLRRSRTAGGSRSVSADTDAKPVQKLFSKLSLKRNKK